MDGLDALLNEAQQERDRKSEAAKKPAAGPRPLPVAVTTPKPARSTAAAASAAPPGTPKCASALKGYLQRLLDPAVLETISVDLSKRSFEEVDRYAMGHPELARYTIELELPRMQYTVIAPTTGERLTAPAEIRGLFEGGRDATAGAAALVWRLANQSLLADLLLPLQVWMDVDLSIAVHARSCQFTVDLRPNQLSVHALAGLSLQTMAAGDEPLELATSEASVRVSWAERRVEQTVEKPRLCKCVVFEEQLHEVAAALAASGALQEGGGERRGGVGGNGGGGLGGGGGGGGEKSSLDDMAAQLEQFMLEDEAGSGENQSSCRQS